MANYVQLNAGLESGLDIAGKLMDHATNRERNSLYRRQLQQRETEWQAEQKLLANQQAATALRNKLVTMQSSAEDPSSVSVSDALFDDDVLPNQIWNGLDPNNTFTNSKLPEGHTSKGVKVNRETGMVELYANDGKQDYKAGEVSLDSFAAATENQMAAFGFVNAYQQTLGGLPKDKPALENQMIQSQAVLNQRGIPKGREMEYFQGNYDVQALHDEAAANAKKSQQTGQANNGIDNLDAAVKSATNVDTSPMALMDPSIIPGETFIPQPKSRSVIPGVGSNLYTGDQSNLSNETYNTFTGTTQTEKDLDGLVTRPDGTVPETPGGKIGAFGNRVARTVVPQIGMLETTQDIVTSPKTAEAAGTVADNLKDFGNELIGRTPGEGKSDSKAPNKVGLDQYFAQVDRALASGQPMNAPANMRIVSETGNYIPSPTSSTALLKTLSSAPITAEGNRKAAAMYAATMHNLNGGVMPQSALAGINELASYGDLMGKEKVDQALEMRQQLMTQVQHIERMNVEQAKLEYSFKSLGQKERADYYGKLKDTIAASKTWAEKRLGFSEGEYEYKMYKAWNNPGLLASAGIPYENGRLDWSQMTEYDIARINAGVLASRSVAKAMNGGFKVPFTSWVVGEGDQEVDIVPSEVVGVSSATGAAGENLAIDSMDWTPQEAAIMQSVLKHPQLGGIVMSAYENGVDDEGIANIVIHYMQSANNP